MSIKPPGGERYIRLDSLGTEYSEAALRKTLDGQHVPIPKIPRSKYTAYRQVKRPQILKQSSGTEGRVAAALCELSATILMRRFRRLFF